MSHHSKFVSVNLNKSYGHGHPSSSSSSTFAHGRGRGMVVLSRPRSSGASGPKLSVPPPLNLPSLRKEHERFDPSSVPARPSGPGSGAGSSALGWTKLGLLPDGDSGGPPGKSSGARPATVGKDVLLRGEDFPSLRATVAKQKDAPKQKQAGQESTTHGRTERTELQDPLDMRPQLRSSHLARSSELAKDEGSRRPSSAPEQPQKSSGYSSGPLPLVRLPQRSDWADDERDTGLGVSERERDRGFDSGRDFEGGRGTSREFLRGDVADPSRDARDGSSWRATPQPRNGYGFREVGVDRDRFAAKPSGAIRETGKDSSYSHLPRVDNARDGFGNGFFDPRYSRRDMSPGTSFQNGRNVADMYSERAAGQNQHGHYDVLSSNRYRESSSFSSGSKGFSLNDPILNFSRDSRLMAKNGESNLCGGGGLYSSDPFSGGLVIKRKKDALKPTDFHDPVRESFEAELERVQRMQELERQRMMEEQVRSSDLARREHQERERLAREEEERRRRVEDEAREAIWRAEQERLEAAKRAEEQKITREEERRRIVMEEERRKEAARQKLLELEARIAKRQAETSVKDDRFPSSVSDERPPVLEKERDVLRASDIGEWEDGERMVEHITSTTSSDFSSMQRYFDAGTRPQYSLDEKYSYMETGRHAYSWRRDTHENGNNSIFLSQDQDSGYHSPRQDVFTTSRGFSKNEIHGNLGPSAWGLSKGGTPEASYVPSDFHHSRGNQWNSAEDCDYFSRNSNTDVDILDNNKFGDAVWGPGSSHGTPHTSYAEMSFQNSEVDEFSMLGRSRHSLKQLRVLPLSSGSSMHNGPFRPVPEHDSSSSFYDSEMRYQHNGKSEEARYNHVYQEKLQQPATAVVTVSLAESTISAEQKVDTNSLRCDSQSSLSVLSPPASPTHLSHEDLDESEDSQVLSISAVGKQPVMSGDGQTVPAGEVGDTASMSSSFNYGEDDEWATENHETMVEQEEYDEDNDFYREEEEAHECNGDNLDPDQEFDGIRPEVPDTSGEVGQTILGFHEGIEITNGEFEKTSRTSEMTIADQEGSVGAVCHGVDAENAFSGGTVTDSSKIINETEKALQDLVLDLGSPANYTLDTVEASGISGMLAQLPISSELSSSMLSTSSGQPMLSPLSTSSVQPMLSPDSAVATQPEGPIELQFGLFSGPLLPSPVPSIQIGSIQLPLHLPQIGPSISQLYPSQASFFQFGQLRYTSPISHGILPLPPHPMTFVQPPSSTYSLDHRLVGSVHNQESQGSSSNSRDKVISAPTLQQPSSVTKRFDVSQNNTNYKINASPDASQNGVTSKNQIGGSSFVDVRSRSTSSSKNDVSSRNHSSGSSFVEVRSRYAAASQTERVGNVSVRKSYIPVAHNEYQVYAEHNSSHFFPGEKGFSRSKAEGMVSSSRGKRFAYTARNAGSRTSFSGQDMPKADSNGFQRRVRRNIRRTEFRVRENADRRQTESLVSFKSSLQNGKPSFNPKVQGHLASYGGKQDAGLSKSTQMMLESANSGAPSCLPATSDSNMDQLYCKDTASKKRMSSVDNSHGGGRNTKRNGSSEDDVDAPLQSNIVQVFKQPGIEAPSDEDDFIQVRSKRQMLNDRRVQREREMKANNRVVKPPRKMRSAPRSTAVTSKSNKSVASLVGDVANDVRFGSSFTVGRGFANVEASPLYTAAVASQSLPLIGTPSTKKDSDAKAESLISTQPITFPMVSSNGSNFSPGLSIENNNRDFDKSPIPFGSWGNPYTNQQVMALTQSQLDEAMQPARFDSHAATSIAREPTMASTSIIMQEKHFSSEKTLSSLVAGDTIQFGAVTSPIILPAVSRASSNGIHASGLGRSDVATVTKLPYTENSCTVFFDKEKCHDEFSAHSVDAEAEAAASAVAAISYTDEIVGNRLSACSVSVSDTKNLNASDAAVLTSKAGVTVSQDATGQFTAEVSPAVSLPADLSVDMPSLPFWPPLPSLQSSSGTVRSHFPAAPPTLFPCFEIIPMLRGPIYAFGSHDESAGSQTQSQSTTLGSGPSGAWPQCHATMDSFYGPTAGFTGPFISPPGGIQGVQGPHHMIVYNHFAPFGQYGQVGLSYMGTTYIPTGKQPDWKHNPVSSAVGVGESDISNLNVVSGPHNPPSMAAPIQHVAPGSLMQMAPPLTMFDMSSFQSSADVPLQACWSHMSGPPIRSVPRSIHLQPQIEGIASHFTRGLPVDTSSGNRRFSEPRAVTVSDGNMNLSVPKVGASQFPAELGPSTITDGVRTCGSSSSLACGNDSKGTKTSKSLAILTVTNVGESRGNGASNTNSGGQIVGSSCKSQATQQYASSRKQYPHAVGHAVRRGSGTSQKVASGGEWHHRMGYQGRKQAPGSDRNFSSSKVKQIYVVKSPGGAAVTG